MNSMEMCRFGLEASVTDLLPRRIAAVVLFLGLAAPVVAGPFEDGASAVKTGDYATVMRLWLPLPNRVKPGLN
jgi:hypothetical protein